MIRAYDEYGNIVDLVEWEKQIRAKAIDDLAEELMTNAESFQDVPTEQVEDICSECKMGKFICDILNEYNRVNDFDKSQSKKMLIRIAELEEQLDGKN